jgi:hypothetical protein
VARVQERHDFLCRCVRVTSQLVGESGSVRTVRALACLYAWRGCHWTWEARAHGPEHTCGAHPEHIRSTVEHHSENLVVSVFLLSLVIGSDCSFRIWLDEIRGDGRESFGNNFWAAPKKFSDEETHGFHPLGLAVFN